jgi:hypothetical protein
MPDNHPFGDVPAGYARDLDIGPRPAVWREVAPWVLGAVALTLGSLLWPWGAEEAPQVAAPPAPDPSPITEPTVAAADEPSAPAPALHPATPIVAAPAAIPTPSTAAAAPQPPRAAPTWAKREWKAAGPRPAVAAPSPEPQPEPPPAAAPEEVPELRAAARPPDPQQAARLAAGDPHLRAVVERLEREVLSVDPGPIGDH